MSAALVDSLAAIAFGVSVAGAAWFAMDLVDRARGSRPGYRRGEVVPVGGRRYRVVSVAADGEPTMTRLEDET